MMINHQFDFSGGAGPFFFFFFFGFLFVARSRAGTATVSAPRLKNEPRRKSCVNRGGGFFFTTCSY
jgi:hypothetical protein